LVGLDTEGTIIIHIRNRRRIIISIAYIRDPSSSLSTPPVTVTVKLQVFVFPQASVATEVTVLWTNRKKNPEAGEDTMVWCTAIIRCGH
jgi:hypothetical protein